MVLHEKDHKDERRDRHSNDPKSKLGADKGPNGGTPDYADCPAALDKNDPNYDSEEEKEKTAATMPAAGVKNPPVVPTESKEKK